MFGAYCCAPPVQKGGCSDDHKRTPRNIDAWYEGHDGMELHRGYPGNVDAEISFRVVLFSSQSLAKASSFQPHKPRLRQDRPGCHVTLSHAGVPWSAHPHPLTPPVRFTRGELSAPYALCDCSNTAMRSFSCFHPMRSRKNRRLCKRHMVLPWLRPPVRAARSFCRTTDHTWACFSRTWPVR
jgi:hypothetical protein